MKELRECKNTMSIDLPPIREHLKHVATLDRITDFLVFTFPPSEDTLDINAQKVFGGPIEPLRFAWNEPRQKKIKKIVEVGQRPDR